MPRDDERVFDTQEDELVMALVESTLRQPSSERIRHLNASAADEKVRREVELLIEWEERMGRFLLDPLFGHGRGSDPFEPGSLVANRFRIVRKVGYGGMGMVFEAIDEKLDRRVALKCAKPGYGGSLPPEARAAREVSHYNVCKVHDLHTVGTPLGDVEFLSMEFIEGDTLSNRIHGGGPVPEREAREIARQLCAGLAQAHRQGVIHGDLKCSNIILALTPEGGMRAVITDFGLARMHKADGSRVTSGGGGTRDYMSPELRLGGHATVASDIYALGILFHIMLTGHAPPAGSKPQSGGRAPSQEVGTESSTVTIAGTILAAGWQRKIAELPSPWNKLVVRCLKPQPEKRIASAEAIGRVLAPQRPALKWTAVAAIVVLLPFGYWQWTASQPGGPPVRLAILPFTVDKGLNQPAAGIAADIADRLSGARRNFTVLSARENQQNRVDDPDKARTILGATHVLQADLHGAGTQVSVSASLLDLASGRKIAQLDETYPAGAAPDLAKAILATVTGALHLRAAPKESVTGAAYAPYVQGIDLLRQDNSANADKAVPLFEKAIQLDPKSALSYAGLAEAQIQLAARGDGEHWTDLARANIVKAKGINSDATPVLLVSGLFEQKRGRYEQAIRDITRATELDPGNSEAWRRLAVTYQDTNRPEEAIATYRKAMEAQPNYYRHYLDLGNFYLSRSEFREAENQYRRVIELAPGSSSGYMNLGLALSAQNREPEAEKALLKALQLRRSPRLLMNLGALYYGQERYSEAVRYLEESMTAGSPSAVQYRNLGDVYRHLGRSKESVHAYRAGRALAEADVTRNPRNAVSRVRLGLLSAVLGDKNRAAFEVSQALAIEPDNAVVLRQATVAYESLRERKKTLDLLTKCPPQLLEGLSREPDLKSLREDPKFQQLLHERKIR